MALLSRFFGRTASEGAAFALGTAVGPALGPAVRELVNEANKTYPSRVIDPGTAAAIVAEDVELRAWGATEAAQGGVDGSRFAALLGEALNAPGLGELFDARRRGEITAADFTHGLRKAKLETRWDAPLEALLSVLLSPTELANARQQGFVSEARQRHEASLQGVTEERADIQYELSGLPLGVETMQGALNRGLVDDETFDQAIREGHTKTKYTGLARALRHPILSATTYATLYLKGWIGKPARDAGGALTGYTPDQMEYLFLAEGRPIGPDAAADLVFRGVIPRSDFDKAIRESDIRPEWSDAVLAHARSIPSPADYVNAHIRGWITEAQMNAGTARHGMSAEDTHLLFLRTGRPAAPGQMATAAARGIDGPDGRPMDKAQFLKGIAESDIRPEWGPMLWESRFLYPPLFQISRLVEAGEITPEKGAEWLVKDRYPPDVVATIKAAWEKPSASTKQTHVQKAQTQLWTATHRAYMAGEATEQEARAMLTHAGVPDAQVDAVIGVWGNELQLVRKQLTATQLRKAWKNVLTNPGTGKPWTRDEVVARLEAMGYSAADAVTFIEEV